MQVTPERDHRGLRVAGLASTLLTVTGLLAVAVHLHSAWLTSCDGWGKPLAAWAVRQHLSDPLLVVEAAFAPVGITVATVVLAVVLLMRRRAREAAFAVVSMINEAILCQAVKTVVARPRPPWQLSEAPLSSYSYPSGHATAIAALGGVVLVVVLVRGRRTLARWALVVSTLAVVAVVAADRVLLGRHYPSDVVGGLAFGGAIVLVTCFAFGLWPPRARQSGTPLT